MISPLLPANHEMTSICFGKANMQCQKLNIIRYLFSLSYMPMHDLLKRKICKKKRKKKRKKNQNALYMIASVSSRRCGSYKMYLKGDSPYQAVMTVYELE